MRKMKSRYYPLFFRGRAIFFLIKDQRWQPFGNHYIIEVLLFVIGMSVFFGGVKFGFAEEGPDHGYFSESKNEELQIQSDELILKNHDSKAYFKGNVVVIHGEMVLEADQMQMHLKKNTQGASSPYSLIGPRHDQEIEKIEAQGNVKFKGGVHRAYSENAEYLKEKGILILTGDPEVWEGESHVKGSKITILIHEQKSIVEQSRMILQPQ